MSRIAPLAGKVKSKTLTRRTPRPETHRFGAGLLRFIPYAVMAYGFTEPSDEDRAAVGPMFAADEPNADDLAAEAEWHRQFEDLDPPPGHCRSCGQAADLFPNGLCGSCDDIVS